LKVKQPELTNNLLQSKGYTNYSWLTPSIARAISKDLDANVFIYGTINQAGEKIRISAQLIDSKTEEVFKSFKLDGSVDKVLDITDSLSSLLRSYLVISSLKKEIDVQFQNGLSNSVEASRNFILGYKAFNKYDNLLAIKSFTQVIKIDSNFIIAYFWLSMSYANQGIFDQAEKWALKMNNNKDKLPFEFKIWANLISAKYVEKSKTEELKYAKQLLGIDDRIPATHWAVGLTYYEMHQYDHAIPEFEKTPDIYNSWNAKPMNAYYYEVLINSYHETTRYQKEKELLKKAIEDFPDDPGLIRRQIILSFAEGDTMAANRNVQRYTSIFKENSLSEAVINVKLAQIYWAAGYTEKAENLYRQALSNQPGNPSMMNNLAYFLIDPGRNLQEGLELVVKALKSDPSCYDCLDTKGWGFYK
jgi:tetratricopeptide (TPR) repeat protein